MPIIHVKRQRNKLTYLQLTRAMKLSRVGLVIVYFLRLMLLVDEFKTALTRA